MRCCGGITTHHFPPSATGMAHSHTLRKAQAQGTRRCRLAHVKRISRQHLQVTLGPWRWRPSSRQPPDCWRRRARQGRPNTHESRTHSHPCDRERPNPRLPMHSRLQPRGSPRRRASSYAKDLSHACTASTSAATPRGASCPWDLSTVWQRAQHEGRGASHAIASVDT
jgi:hypothetical protein